MKRTPAVGLMGWSYGGQLAGFILTHDPDRARAVSIGAGVLDMRTNYGNTDLPDHGRHYNGGTPWDRPEAYAKASALTYVKGAKAPILIQHILFSGSGHILPTPKMLRAATQQNYDWFNHFIWGDPLIPSGTGAW